MPIDIVLGDDGNLWFTEWAGKIGRIEADGTVTEWLRPNSRARAALIAIPMP